jgi:hypothetical protein
MATVRDECPLQIRLDCRHAIDDVIGQDIGDSTSQDQGRHGHGAEGIPWVNINAGDALQYACLSDLCQHASRLYCLAYGFANIFIDVEFWYAVAVLTVSIACDFVPEFLWHVRRGEPGNEFAPVCRVLPVFHVGLLADI